MSAYQTTGFALPEDGWFHIATPGEWPHKPTGLVQVLDDDAMQAIVDAFVDNSKQPNWPGVLIDFDHQSLDQDKPTVAAGWIIALEKRPNGIWGQIRWSDLGKQSIEGGRYRFISPVWKSSDCAPLDDVKIRPLKLMNCAVTNDPNIKGLFPLSNARRTTPMLLALPAMPIANQTLRNPMDARESTREMSEKQLRWWFAQQGRSGGGGGGGGSGGGSSVSSGGGSSSSGAGSNTSGASETPSGGGGGNNERIKNLESLRDKVESMRPPKPVPFSGYEMIDVNSVERAARSRGASAQKIKELRDQAMAENGRRKSELNALKRQLERQYTTPEARERALAREIEKRKKASDKAQEDWRKQNYAADKEVERINRAIDDEKKRSANEATKAEEKRAREQEKAIKAQIAADKEAQRKEREQKQKEELERKQREDEEKRPIKQAQQDRQRLNEYYAAVQRGDMDTAGLLYPDADHARVKGDLDKIRSANPRSASDIRAMNKYLADYKMRLPPGVKE